MPRIQQEELDALFDSFSPSVSGENKIFGTVFPSGVVLIWISGRTLGGTGLDLIERIDDLVREQHGDIVIDLSHCEFLSSVAIGVLAELAFDRSLEHGRVYLCAPNRKIRQVLDLIGCDNFFCITESLQEALDRAGGPREGLAAESA